MNRRVTKPQWIAFWLMTFVAGLLIGIACTDDSVCRVVTEWVR